MRDETDSVPHTGDIIADGVRTYPLAATPPTLAPAVMAHVRALAAPLRFRLTWMDYALGLFGASMAGVLWFFWPSWLTDEFPDLTIAALPTLEVPGIPLALASVFGGLVLLIGCMLVASLVLGPTAQGTRSIAPRAR